jgi:hypothetical protein
MEFRVLRNVDHRLGTALALASFLGFPDPVGRYCPLTPRGGNVNFDLPV